LKSGSLDLLEPSGPVQACNGIALPCIGFIHILLRDLQSIKAMHRLVNHDSFYTPSSASVHTSQKTVCCNYSTLHLSMFLTENSLSQLHTDHSKRSEIGTGHPSCKLCYVCAIFTKITPFSTISKMNFHENLSSWSCCAMMMYRHDEDHRCFPQLWRESNIVPILQAGFKKSLATVVIRLPQIMVWQKQKQHKRSVSSAAVQDAAVW